MKQWRWPALIGALVLAMTASGFAQTQKRLLAYYYFGDQTATPHYDAKLIPYKKLTHIAHVVVQPNPVGDGTIVISKGAIEPTLIPSAHKAKVKVMACVQGAAALFSKVASTPQTRETFAKSLLEFVTKYDYDGVDIDWEVPQGAADKQNSVLLMQALRTAMPSPKYVLSMATPSVPGKWGDFDFDGLSTAVDFYNVMTYDFHGPWTDHAGHNSPLFQSATDPKQEGSLNDSMNLYLDQLKVPPEKINLGTAFYGYQFPVGALDAACNCAKTASAKNYGSQIKSNIGQPGWTAHVDPVAMAPYLTHEAEPASFITYDDAESTRRKVDYAIRARNLGGVFMWEISGDYDGKNQELMDAFYKAFVSATKEAK